MAFLAYDAILAIQLLLLLSPATKLRVPATISFAVQKALRNCSSVVGYNNLEPPRGARQFEGTAQDPEGLWGTKWQVLI